LGLTADDLSRPVTSLSGGERMRVSLARLIVQRPDLLLLDEPTNHLDTKAMEWLEEYLQKYSGAVLLISHDRYFIDKCAKGVLGFINNKVIPFESFSLFRAAENESLIQQSKEPLHEKVKASRESSGSGNSKCSAQGETSYAARGTNRLKERRDIALRKEQLRTLEKEIEEFENMQKSMESAFSKDTRPEEYAQYAANAEKLSAAYDRYIRLSEEENS